MKTKCRALSGGDRNEILFLLFLFLLLLSPLLLTTFILCQASTQLFIYLPSELKVYKEGAHPFATTGDLPPGKLFTLLCLGIEPLVLEPLLSPAGVAALCVGPPHLQGCVLAQRALTSAVLVYLPSEASMVAPLVISVTPVATTVPSMRRSNLVCAEWMREYVNRHDLGSAETLGFRSLSSGSEAGMPACCTQHHL